jgi:hypothetical protein
MDAEYESSGGTPTIIAVFENLDDAEYALEALRRTGLEREDVSLIVRDPNAEDTAFLEGDTGTNIISGATAGATVGGLVGGLAGGLLALLVPGLGPVLGTGVLANALAGLAVGAAGGGILGALLGLGVPEEEAAAYQEHVQAGRVLMTIRSASHIQARQIVAALDTSNAYDVRIYGGSPVASSGPKAPATAATVPAAVVPVAAPAAAAPGPVDRTLAAPPPPDQPGPLTSGDVAAVAEGGPDVRGESDEEAVASRGLTDTDADLSAWRSGGEETRAESSAERGLGGAGPQSEAPAPTGGGDVAAVAGGGPDVRPPGADTRDLTTTGSDSWADDPAEWRSGGEAARDATGEGVGAAPSTDRGLDLSTPPTTATLEATMSTPEATPPPRDTTPPPPDAPAPDDTYYTNPRLLSRSALRVAGSTAPAAPVDRSLDAEVGNPNPEGYGDANT